ncbi:MAG: hypothetical protein ACD_8C00056G0012 [uncultured bacterium]|nr:MAG: hypothetical protein ACD_8C00056G0012 [uncultured bacterium]
MEISGRDYHIFLLKAVLLIGFAWGGFLLALVGFFYASIVVVTTIIAGILILHGASKNGFSFLPSREISIASILFLLVTISFLYFSTPSVFTGRDQGSFSEAAIRLSQNHQLEFSTPTSEEFFKLNQPGRALNFPGFYYTLDGKLITQFSLAYISWLALFFSLFGLIGFSIANGVLFFTFLMSFYMLGRMSLKVSNTIPMMLFAITSFVFMWFSKFTLSENMALMLIWVAILSLMLFLKNFKALPFTVFLLTTGLLCFTRIEGLAFLVTSIVILALNEDARKYIGQKLFLRFFLPVILFSLVFVANAFSDIYFYKEIAKALLPSVSSPKATYLGQIKNNVLPDFYTIKIFCLYGLIGFFFVGGAGMIISFWKKEYHKLIPFFFVAPTFIYLFDSQITPDHPWMLRRFMFSILPIAIYYSGLFFGHLLENRSTDRKHHRSKILSVAIIAILVGMNLPAFSKYFTFSENEGLLTQVQEFGEKFSADDLILIDQKASGDGWSMIAGPMNFLHGKNAVYFFNNHDLTKLDTSKFKNIYLVSPNEQVPLYLSSTIGEKLTPVSDYKFNLTKLNIQPASPLKDLSLPEKLQTEIGGKVFKVTR